MPDSENQMAPPYWQLEGTCCRLSAGSLIGKIDVDAPAGGITALSWHGKEIAGTILGVTAAGVPSADAFQRANAYVRGHDLVVEYTHADRRQLAMNVYWSVVHHDAKQIWLETIVSIQTALLESHPQILCTTELAAEESRSLLPTANEASEAFESLATGDEPREASPEAGILLRLPGGVSSYTESVHPSDVISFQSTGSRGGVHRLTWQLASGFLEKGVIRRARVRSAFLPRENDLRLASQGLAQFLAEPPPLTS